MNNDYSLYLISNKSVVYNEIQTGLDPEVLHFFDGTGVKNFSTLVNTCVASASTETVILMSDKVRPTKEHVDKTLKLLDDGYAFVGLYLFRFFGFKKELFRRIGFFDERYIGTGYEDYDFLVRLIENNLAFWTEESVPYIDSPSQWTINGHYPGYDHWCRKWKHHWVAGSHIPVAIERTVPEETYNYNLGPSVSTEFLQGQEKCFNSNYPHAGAFFDMEIVSSARMRHGKVPSNIKIGV
jgi:hypothetical protein